MWIYISVYCSECAVNFYDHPLYLCQCGLLYGCFLPLYHLPLPPFWCGEIYWNILKNFSNYCFYVVYVRISSSMNSINIFCVYMLCIYCVYMLYILLCMLILIKSTNTAMSTHTVKQKFHINCLINKSQTLEISVRKAQFNMLNEMYIYSN